MDQPVIYVFTHDSIGLGGDGPTHWPIEQLMTLRMISDPILLTRGDESEAEWSIITPIEEAWAQLPVPDVPNYPAGSEGLAPPRS